MYPNPQMPPRRKSHTTRNVLLSILGAFVLLFGGCTAIVAAASGGGDQGSVAKKTAHTGTASQSPSPTAGLTASQQAFVDHARDKFGFDGNSDDEVLDVGRTACGYRRTGSSADDAAKKLKAQLSGSNATTRAGIVDLAQKYLCRKYAPKPIVEFVVTGTGSPDVMYGSDSDSRQGSSNLPFHATMKLDTKVNYYTLTAQLNGGGDITCKLIIKGHVVATGHASGGYNICDAQASQGLTGDWTSD